MKTNGRLRVILFVAAVLAVLPVMGKGQYKNFKVSTYIRAQDVARMADDKFLGGGITYTRSETTDFETYSYARPVERQQVREVAEYTTKLFDDFILDDFFFIDLKNDDEIAAKGTKSWTEYRLRLMADAGRELVVEPAKKVNPKVKVIIKYPNWYDHFHGLGFNLEEEPSYFDGLWTGTETRDPASAQHLQNYLSYNIIRYFDNIAPGKNGGPIGLVSYKPYHSSGEDFLQNYLGMIGLPMDMYPQFLTDRQQILLTEQAAKDPQVVEKIKAQLKKGGDVIITTGLLKAIREKIADICELYCGDLKAIVNDFGYLGKSEREFIIPQVKYFTNDAWEVVPTTLATSMIILQQHLTSFVVP